MKRMSGYLAILISVCLLSGCMGYVNIDKNTDNNPDNPKEEITAKKDSKEDTNKEQADKPINPVLIQKLGVDQAKAKAEKTYGGKDVMIKLNGEYETDGMLYYVFDFGTDIDGMFYKDFSVVVDAQSGEMFEGTYDKKANKIVRY